MKNVELAYGKAGLKIRVPNEAEVLLPRHAAGLADEHESVIAALRHPIETPPLRDMVKSSDRVAIVISDLTRPTPNYKLVPWIMEELSHVPRGNFVIVNGVGSHRANTRAELISMLGEQIVDTVEIENHDAFDDNKLVHVGRNSYGSDVFLNKTYVESSFKIVTGFIEPHFFAGFSGGPKGINPGIAGIRTITDFHNAFMIGHPNSTWGRIDGNVVQDAATQNCLMSKPDFMVNVTLNGGREITNVFSGDVIKAHRVGCEYVRQSAMQAVAQPYDIVVTTNSGYPLDQNLYQTVKGMSAAAQIVCAGGAIVCASECSDGVPAHGNYARILKMRDTAEELLRMIHDPSFQIFDQWQVQVQANIQMKANCYLFSSLNDEVVKGAKFTPVASVQESIDELLRQNASARLAILPLGPLTIPYVSGIQ